MSVYQFLIGSEVPARLIDREAKSSAMRASPVSPNFYTINEQILLVFISSLFQIYFPTDFLSFLY